MAMEKITRPYEVLVRLGRDGITAAHVIEIEEVLEDGEVTFARELGAKPLALAGAEFGSIVEKIDQTTLAERDDLKAKNDVLNRQCSDLEAEVRRLQAAVAFLKEHKVS